MKKQNWTLITMLSLLMVVLFSTAQSQIDDDMFLSGQKTEDICAPENMTTPYDNYQSEGVPEEEIKKWYSFGSEYYKNKNYEAALPYLWKVFLNDTAKYAVLSIRKIAYSYFSLQMVDSTLIACYRGLERYPNHTNLHYYAGYLQDNLGKFRCAIPHYEKLVEDEPEEKTYLEKLAFLYYKDENQKAMDVQKSLVDLDPKNAEYQKTYILYVTHFLGDPLEALRSAYKTDPSNIDLALSYGKTAHDQGQYKESIDPLSAVLAKDINHVEAHKYRAMSLEGLGQYNAAIADYKQILNTEPDNAEIMCAIAVAYKNMDQFSNGKFWVGKALQSKPGYGLAHMTMAEIYESSVTYCQNTEKRGRKYDDGLVYQKAYESYAQAAKDNDFKANALRRMDGLKTVLPTQEEKFMNENRQNITMDCYNSWIK